MHSRTDVDTMQCSCEGTFEQSTDRATRDIHKRGKEGAVVECVEPFQPRLETPPSPRVGRRYEDGYYRSHLPLSINLSWPDPCAVAGGRG